MSTTEGFDPHGWLRAARRVCSPNFDQRPSAARVDLLVIHNISLPPGAFGSDTIDRLFTNRLDARGHPFFAALQDLRVSSHFLIGRDGGLTQYVAAKQRAWHAGRSSFEGRDGCNDYSLGIELEGTDFTDFEALQYERLAQLTVALRAAYPIRAVRGHSDIAPGRKTDPGPLFDWLGYAARAHLPSAMLPARARAAQRHSASRSDSGAGSIAIDRRTNR